MGKKSFLLTYLLLSTQDVIFCVYSVHYAAAKGLDDCLNVLLAHNANNSTRDVTGI